MRTYLKDFQEKKGATILLASHNMAEVERLCDQVVMMKQGSIMDRDSPAGLLKNMAARRLKRSFWISRATAAPASRNRQRNIYSGHETEQ